MVAGNTTLILCNGYLHLWIWNLMKSLWLIWREQSKNIPYLTYPPHTLWHIGPLQEYKWSWNILHGRMIQDCCSVLQLVRYNKKRLSAVIIPINCGIVIYLKQVCCKLIIMQLVIKSGFKEICCTTVGE